MTLAGADKRLRQNPDGIMREAEVVEHLQHIRSMLVELRTQLGGEENVVAEFDEEADEIVVPTELAAEEFVEDVAEVTEEVAEEDVAEELEIEEVTEPIAEEVAPAEEEAAKKPKFVEVAMFPEEEIAPKTEVKKEEKKSERRIVEQTLF